MTRTLAADSRVVAVIVCRRPLAGQAPAGYKTPHTPWGDPDLQGIWPSTDMVGVPIERPVEFGTRATLSDTEFQQRQSQAARQAQADDEEVAPRAGGGGDGTGRPRTGASAVEAQRQNSLIVGSGRRPHAEDDAATAPRVAMRAQKSSTGDGPFSSAADLDYTTAASRAAWSARCCPSSTTTAPRSCRRRATWRSATR
jgi:hypothetical protein